VEDVKDNITLVHPTTTFQNGLNPSLKLVETMKLPPSQGIV
jgi:hypothetical protein